MLAFSSIPGSAMRRFSRRLPLLLAVSLLIHLFALEWAAGNLQLGFSHAEDPVMEISLPPPSRAETRLPSPPRPVHRAAAPMPHPVHRQAAPAPAAVPAPSLSPQPEAQAETPPIPSPTVAEATVATEKPETPAVPTTAESEQVPHRYAVSPPPSVELLYDVQQIQRDGGSRSGHGSIEWRRNGGTYSVDGNVGVLIFSLLTFKSEGELDEFGVSPVLYSEKRFRRSETDTHFHRGRNLISFSASENSYPRQGGEQDRASLMWQLAGIGRADSSLFVPGGEIGFMVAGVRDAEPWIFSVVGQEDIRIGIGETAAWHLARKPRAGSYEQALDIWLAPQREWYPVKIKYTETNGSYLEMVVTDIQPRQEE